MAVCRPPLLDQTVMKSRLVTPIFCNFRTVLSDSTSSMQSYWSVILQIVLRPVLTTDLYFRASCVWKQTDVVFRVPAGDVEEEHGSSTRSFKVFLGHPFRNTDNLIKTFDVPVSQADGFAGSFQSTSMPMVWNDDRHIMPRLPPLASPSSCSARLLSRLH